MVPGFMAGVQALHDRFGKLSFSTLFAPAISVAENGVPMNAHLELGRGYAMAGDSGKAMVAYQGFFTL